MELDETDYKILDVLRRDARTPFTEVGRDLGISDATVHVRVNNACMPKLLQEETLRHELKTDIYGWLM